MMILLLLCLIQPLHASIFSLKVEIHGYDNPNGWNSSKICCDRGPITGTCYRPCETIFHICLRNGDTSQADSNCPLSSTVMTSDIIPGDSLVFGVLVGNLPNPLTFMLDSLHSSGIQVYVRIEDDDRGGFDDDLGANIADLIDEVFIQVPSITGSNAANSKRNGIHGAASINISYQLTCVQKDYYGNNCSVYCKPQDNSTGHYNCNEATGAKECLPGYVDPDTNCICSVSNPNCLMPTSSSHISSSSQVTQMVSSSKHSSSHISSSSQVSQMRIVSSNIISTNKDASYHPSTSVIMISETEGLASPIPTLDPTVPAKNKSYGSVIIIIATCVSALIGVITIFVLIVFVVWRRRHMKANSLPDTNNTGNVYYSTAKDPYISGNKNINNPLYIEQHDKKVSDKHTYEFMDGPKVPGATASINKTDSMDYQVLYETPVDGVSSGPNNIPQQDIFLGSTQIALDLSGNVQIAKSECKNTKNEGPADYEEPCCASHCTENQYTALDSKAVSSSAVYEMPRNANNNYEEPWKKLF